MTPQDFELLCSLNALRPNTQGWTPEQSAIICQACSQLMAEEIDLSTLQRT